MTTLDDADTSDVSIKNVPCVRPAATVIADGCAAIRSLLAISTSTPPTGAASVRVTVAMTSFVPMTDTGAMESEAIVTGGGSIVTVVERVIPLRVAETTTGVD